MKYGLFFGDSVTYGEYDGVFGGWVDILKRYALQKYNEGSRELILFNLGIGGETTEGLVKRISHEMEARNSPEGNVVFIGYGANDLATKEGVPAVGPERFKANMVTAIQKAKHYAADLYLISILPVAEKIDGVTVASGKLRNTARILKYNQILRETAHENAAAYLDFYSGFVDGKEVLLSGDGVHPNEKGYGIMAEMAIPVIEKYL